MSRCLRVADGDNIAYTKEANNKFWGNLMADIYITGHRNPDLDSVCSAYVYASLKNKLDKDNNYIAVRCGHLSDSSHKILDALNIDVPPYMPDLFPKVADVMHDAVEKYDVSDPLTNLAKLYKESNPSATPVYDKGKYAGLISIDDIADYYLKTLQSRGNTNEVPTIGDVMREQEEPLQVNDLFEEAKLLLSQSQNRGLAVYKGEEFAGFVTRRCFLKAPKYNVILVDHNEPKQSIKGIETANLLEIIDHHRLDALKTDLPIFIDAEPLGSTCTIVYQLFVRNKLKPTPEEAKVLLTGMIADTLILKSPTTTAIDINSADQLAKICGVDVTHFGLEMFSHIESLANQKPEKAILSDFKRYSERGSNFGIGQCEVTTLSDIDQYKEQFMSALDDVRKKNGLDWAVVMITDVMKENSILITTECRAAKFLPYATIEPGLLDMPGVMSRKKQLLPEMIYSLGM